MNPAADLTTPIMQTAAALAVVLGGMFGLVYIARRLMRRNGVASAHPLIRVVDHHYLGFKKQISLIQVPGALLVLGLSNDSICLLTKIDDRNPQNCWAGLIQEDVAVINSDVGIRSVEIVDPSENRNN